jgi:acyl-CoA dehydrogenase
MDFEYSAKVKAIETRLRGFMEEFIYPNEARHAEEIAAGDRWQPTSLLEELKGRAKAAGLWNLFLPDSKRGGGLTNLEYAPLCEIMGRSPLAPEAFNCSAPDTGNMEVLERYGTEAQKRQWLEPLLEGRIRSCFAMTEPAVASSDATNISSTIRRDGDHYVINGRKWWTTGAPDRRCRIILFMGKTDPGHPDRHRQQSMILVPMDTPGVKLLRRLPVFGYDDAPNGTGELFFEDVRVPATNLLLGEGRGFEIAQGRLGPGRVHHCMRAIGQAERTLEKTCARVKTRVTFGKPIAEQTVTLERIAEARILIDQARLLVLKTASMMDVAGNKAARAEIAMIKVAVPNMLCRVVDMAIQAHGAAGVSDDFGLAKAYAEARALRIVDGPDEVHRNQIGRLELEKTNSASGGIRTPVPRSEVQHACDPNDRETMSTGR